jgi:hypothetical protein
MGIMFGLGSVLVKKGNVAPVERGSDSRERIKEEFGKPAENLMLAFVDASNKARKYGWTVMDHMEVGRDEMLTVSAFENGTKNKLAARGPAPEVFEDLIQKIVAKERTKVGVVGSSDPSSDCELSDSMVSRADEVRVLRMLGDNRREFQKLTKLPIDVDVLQDGCLYRGGDEARMRALDLFGLTRGFTKDDKAILMQEEAFSIRVSAILKIINRMVRGGWFEMKGDEFHFIRHDGFGAYLKKCNFRFSAGSPHLSILNPNQMGDGGWYGTLDYEGGGEPMVFGMFNGRVTPTTFETSGDPPSDYEAINFLWRTAIEMENVRDFSSFRDIYKYMSPNAMEQYRVMKRLYAHFKTAIGEDYASFRRAFLERNPGLMP